MNMKGITLGLGLLLGSVSASALNIALTNDDGWDSEGIKAMKEALVASGHTVTLVAPLDGQSGSSAGLNLGPVEIVKQAEGEYSVALPGGTEGAEPATCALLAMSIAGEPDLLVSGINDGANTGAFTAISGTVGAAIAALNSSLNGSLPAIAVSTDRGGSAEHYRQVAAFTANLISHLESRPGFLASEEGLLPQRVGLNINYPLIENPKGVVISVQGQTSRVAGVPFPLQLNFTCEECAGLEIGGEPAIGGRSGTGVDSSDDVKNGDAEQFANGYITIVPIRGDYTAPSPLRFKSVLEGFNY